MDIVGTGDDAPQLLSLSVGAPPATSQDVDALTTTNPADNLNLYQEDDNRTNLHPGAVPSNLI
ncbi:hypothetical protein HDU76_006817, partial [Blyttiomyces sp. JEL0837]